MYSQPINLNTDDEYLMGKEKEPEKEDEELKKVCRNSPAIVVPLPHAWHTLESLPTDNNYWNIACPNMLSMCYVTLAWCCREP